jgi:hypothetical protein
VSSYADHGHPDGNGRRGGPGAPSSPAHDRRARRRAVAAGGGAAVVVGGFLGVGLAPAGGTAVAAGVLLGVAIGAIVAALWSAIGVGLDILADRHPGRRRLVWTGVLAALSFVATGFALAAGVTA